MSRRSYPRGRPWRAVAYLPGPPRWHLSRTSALTRTGLDAFVDRWQAIGAAVDVWEVLPLPEVEQAAATAGSPPVPSPS